MSETPRQQTWQQTAEEARRAWQVRNELRGLLDEIQDLTDRLFVAIRNAEQCVTEQEEVTYFHGAEDESGEPVTDFDFRNRIAWLSETTR